MSLTVTFESVQKAKTCQLEQEKIYYSVFYDAQARPKLRKWLVKKGVPLRLVDDLESEMRVALFNQIQKYNHDKIPFEKYVWTVFQQMLITWFITKTKTKNKRVSIDELIEIHGDSIELNLGNVSSEENDVDFDVEAIFIKMEQRQAFIARCLYYNNWTHKEVREYLEISSSQYHVEIASIRSALAEYFSA